MTSRDPRRCYEAVRSAILATVGLLVIRAMLPGMHKRGNLAYVEGVCRACRQPSAMIRYDIIMLCIARV